jgi:hypothetical protein
VAAVNFDTEIRDMRGLVITRHMIMKSEVSLRRRNMM